MKTSRTALFRLMPDQSIHKVPGFDPEIYSRFKYGCVNATRVLATQMASLLHMQISESTIIMSSAYKQVPTAAALLLEEMLKLLPVIPISSQRIHRSDIFDFDFARLTEEERKNAMQNITYRLDLNSIRNQSVVIIDDAYVTGTHETKVRSSMVDYPSTLHLYYIIDLSLAGFSTIEAQLNRLQVKDVFDLLPLIDHPDFIFNSRALKFIFSADLDTFSTFCSILSSNRLDQLTICAQKEEYFKMKGNIVANFHHLLRMEKTI